MQNGIFEYFSCSHCSTNAHHHDVARCCFATKLISHWHHDFLSFNGVSASVVVLDSIL